MDYWDGWVPSVSDAGWRIIAYVGGFTEFYQFELCLPFIYLTVLD